MKGKHAPGTKVDPGKLPRGGIIIKSGGPKPGDAPGAGPGTRSRAHDGPRPA